MGAPWLNTKMVVAVSPDTDRRRSRAMSITRSRRAAIRRATSSSSTTRAARPTTHRRKPIEGQHPWRIVGKMGIDATAKSRHDPADFERAWPRNWGKVKLEDYL